MFLLFASMHQGDHLPSGKRDSLLRHPDYLVRMAEIPHHIPPLLRD